MDKIPTVESTIKEQLERIFGMKVSFNRPSEQALEQDILFVQFGTVRSRIQDGKEHHRVEGRGFCYTQHEKMPLGFFRKRIQEAKLSDQQPFTFFNIESNEPTYLNIGQRGFEFVYLYSGQFNPPSGTITEVEFIEEGDTP